MADLTENEIIQFNRGWLLACTTFNMLHDQPRMAGEVLAQAEISAAEAYTQHDLTEVDKEHLAIIRSDSLTDPLT